MFIRCSVESVMWVVDSWQWCDVNIRRCVSFSFWKRCACSQMAPMCETRTSPTDHRRICLNFLKVRVSHGISGGFLVLLLFSQKVVPFEVSFTEKKDCLFEILKLGSARLVLLYVCRPVVLLNLSLSCCQLLRNVY